MEKIIDSKTQGLYNGEVKNDYVGVEDSDMPEEAEAQLDCIENLTHDYLRALARCANVDDLNWNMELIGQVTEVAVTLLKDKDVPIWYPYIGESEGMPDEKVYTGLHVKFVCPIIKEDTESIEEQGFKLKV